MGLSSNILWHQTDYNGLKHILDEKCFKCSYSLETIKWGGSQTIVGFPMISFSNLPFADIAEYLNQYGGYSIGLKIEWGNQNGISPVWYRDAQSHTLNNEMRLFSNLKNKKDLSAEDIAICEVIANTKNIEGELVKRKFKNYRFYNEREMRWMPTYSQLQQEGRDLFLDEKQYQGARHVFLNGYELSFTVADLVYIIVQNSNQINKIRRILSKDNVGNVDSVLFLSHSQVKHDILGIGHNKKII